MPKAATPTRGQSLRVKNTYVRHYGITDIVEGGAGTDTLIYLDADRSVRVPMADAALSGFTHAGLVTG
jgi:hypothetical protein